MQKKTLIAGGHASILPYTICFNIKSNCNLNIFRLVNNFWRLSAEFSAEIHGILFDHSQYIISKRILIENNAAIMELQYLKLTK